MDNITDTPSNTGNTEGDTMTTTTEDVVFQAEIVLQETIMLSANERCDECGAQAYVEVEMKNGKLLFCGHDFNTHAEVLKKTAKRILDYRYFLTKKPV